MNKKRKTIEIKKREFNKNSCSNFRGCKNFFPNFPNQRTSALISRIINNDIQMKFSKNNFDV